MLEMAAKLCSVSIDELSKAKLLVLVSGRASAQQVISGAPGWRCKTILLSPKKPKGTPTDTIHKMQNQCSQPPWVQQALSLIMHTKQMDIHALSDTPTIAH